jgi:hypothetical protein
MKKLILLPLILFACSEQVEQKTPEELEEERLRALYEHRMDSLQHRIDSVRTENDRRQLEYKKQIQGYGK